MNRQRLTAGMIATFASVLTAQTRTDSVTIRIVNTELRAALQIMQQYLDRPILFTGGSGPAVTVETPVPIARHDVPRLVRGLLDAHGFELVEDSLANVYRARPRETSRAPTAPPSALPVDDRARAAAATELFVLPLKHARATDVTATINSLFLRQMGASSGSPGRGEPLPVGSTPGRAPALSGELTIVADARTNSLLIRANRADFSLIRGAVEQIDVRPAQVLIETVVVEARRDRNFSLGVSAAVADQHVANTKNASVGGTFTPGSGGLADFTLKVMGVGPWDFDATIRAAASRGDVRIVSRPVVLAANDEQAEVIVGSQRPFVQVSRSLPTDAAVRDQVIQYRDVGTKLTVRPTISIDGIVSLAVTQEVSSATAETAFNAPVISTRSVKTELLVRDGQTIVLGGLTDRQRDVQTSGVPILSRLPFIGGLFGSQSRFANESELFIFLTPRVIRTDEDARRLTDPLADRAKGIRP